MSAFSDPGSVVRTHSERPIPAQIAEDRAVSGAVALSTRWPT